MSMTDDRCASPVPQEQQHHEAGEERAERSFGYQTLDGIRDVARLVETVADA